MDISLRGALFETDPADYGLNGTACRLHTSSGFGPINGIVVHSDDGLLGVKFIGVTKQTLADLHLIIASSQAELSMLEPNIPALLRA